MAVRVAIVVVAMTGIAYYHVFSLVTEKSLEQLDKYIVERGAREGAIFNLAEDNHEALKKEILERLAALGDADPRQDFERLHERLPDGTVRTRREGFDGTREAFTYIGRSVDIDADIRRRVMTFLDLSNQFGPAWHHRLENVYFTMPENILVGYWPEVPDWAHAASADLYMPDEEYVWAADMAHNPDRDTVWTGLFYDAAGQTWMVSAETPVDLEGRQIATIGHDITLNELLERTINDHLEGAYNIILRRDGRLIAHPEWAEQIKAEGGYFDILESGDAQLKSIYEALRNREPAQRIVESGLGDNYLAATEIAGGEWYFVTVYPKHLVSHVARDTASIILLLGLLSLLIEIAVLYLVLRRDVALPLGRLVKATDQIASGNYAVDLDSRRKDELGRLAEALQVMAGRISSRTTELRESEERYARAIQGTNDGIWDWNIVTGEGYLSPRWEEIVGYEPGEVAPVAQSFFDLIHPDDVDLVSAAVQDHLERRISYDTEFRLRHKSGDYIWVRARGQATWDEDGTPLRMAGSIADITEQKRAEVALRNSEASLLNAQRIANLGNWDWNIVTGELYWSDQIYRIFGLEPQQFGATYDAFLQSVHPDDRAAVQAAVDRALSGEEPYAIDHRIVLPDGEERIVHEQGEVVLDASDKPLRMSGTVQDITEQKRAELEIHRLNESLERRVEERTSELRAAQGELLRQERLATLGQLTATVSHELRNPLGVIRTSAYTLRNSLNPETPRAVRSLERVERSVVRCDRIIDELLDFTRISDLESEPTALDEWLDEVLAEQALPPGVVLQRDPGLPGTDVAFDRDRLRRAVINVFDNACQAMLGAREEPAAAGERVLTVRTRAHAGRVELVFEDRGPGIASEVYERIFEPMFSTKGFGVGLGLPVVKQIMAQHGGGIEVETEIGRGTIVRLWLDPDADMKGAAA